jgi:hypothetical protein
MTRAAPCILAPIDALAQPSYVDNNVTVQLDGTIEYAARDCVTSWP